MDRRTFQDLWNYCREVGTERRALRARGDRRRHGRVLRFFFIPLSQLMHRLRKHNPAR